MGQDVEVFIYGVYRVRPGFEERVKASLLAHEARTSTEPGCLAATVSQDLADPQVLHSMQRWASRRHLDAHRALPHVRSMDGSAGDVLEEPFVLRVLEQVAEARP